MSHKIAESPTQLEKDSDGNKSLNLTLNSVDMLFNQSHSMLKSPGALQNLSDLIFQQMRLDQVGELKGNAPTIPVNDLKGPEAGNYSRQEKILRCSLAALYRLVDLNGWTQSIYNHISVRSTTNPDHYLLNPFGLLYHEIQASSLVLVDTEGKTIDPGTSVLGINKAGWVLHSAIHDSRKDVHCVIHIHTPDVVAVSCIKSGLLPVSPEAQELINSCGVKYHDYNGILIDAKERKSIQEDLGDSAKVLFLRSHGVAIAAANIPEAWYILRRVINACQTQMRLLQLGMGKTILGQLQEHQSNGITNGIKKSLSINGGQQRPFESLITTTSNEGEAMKTSDNETTRIDEKIDNEIWTVEEQEFEAEMRVLDSAGYKTGHVYKKPNLLRRTPMNNTMFLGDTIMSGNNYDTMADASALMSDSMGDDIMTASQAGKSHMNKIAENVRSHREKSVSRRQDHPGINEVSTPKNDKITPKDLINQKSLLNTSSYEQSHNTNAKMSNGKSSEKTVTLPPNNEMKNSANSQSLLDAKNAETKKKSSSFRNIFKRP